MTIRPIIRGEAAAMTTLRDAGGRVHLPGEERYEMGRRAWAAAVDQRPAAVAEPATAEQAAAVVRAAASAGLRVAPQGTGHNAAPLGGLSDAVLLRTTAMTGVFVRRGARRARARAGMVWEDVVGAAGDAGLAALHGSSPNVGVVGYSLGGGMGWYARALGLAANSVTGAELITADGDIVWVDASHEPELFWALRGGGGNFGLVTDLEFALFDVGAPYAGLLVWDWRDADPVLRRWRDWAVSAPDHVTTSFRLLQLPVLPMIPEPFQGRQLAVIDGAVLGDAEEGERILAPLRELGPEVDTFAPTGPAALVRLHMDPEDPTPAVSDSLMVSGLPDAAIDAMLAAAGPGSGSTLFMTEIRQLGGALGRPHPGAGALPMLSGQFVCFALALALTPEMAEAGEADAQRVAASLAAWASGQYLNFAESPVDASAAYGDGAWERLRAIRSAVDPDGVFLANHPVPAA